MKSYFKFSIFLILIFSFFSNPIKAENKINANNKYFEEVIEEKLKVDIEEIQRLLKENPQQLILKATKAQAENIIQSENNEVQITSNTAAESELTVAINPKDTNNIIIAPIRQTNSSTNPITVPIYYTKNFGKTWNLSSFAPLPTNPKIYTIGGGDPVCIFDDNGIAYLTWISLGMKLNSSNTKIDSLIAGLHFATSSDGGATWSYDLYQNISLAASYMPNGQLDLSKLEFFDDKQWLSVDNNPNSQYHNNVYISFSRFDNTLNGSADIRVSVKERTSNKFSDRFANVSNGLGALQQFSSNMVLSDGTLVTIFYSQSITRINSIYSAISSDGGKTFQTPVKITDFIFANSRLIPSSILDTIDGVDYSRLYPSIYCASDNSISSEYRGNGYIAWSAFGVTTKSETGSDIYFSKTTDGGKTWSQPKIISNETGETPYHQFYPSITVNPDGIIVMSWYEQGVNGIKSLANYVVSFSFDGGETFTKPIIANVTPTDFKTVGLKNNKFGIGEYNQIVATKNYAIPVWSDGRLNNGDLNIYAAFIPISDKTDVTVEKISSINQNSLQISVAPNPANQFFDLTFLNCKNAPVKYILYDLQGNVILENQTLEQDVQINSENLKSGTYFIQAEQNGIKAIQKVIINK